MGHRRELPSDLFRHAEVGDTVAVINGDLVYPRTITRVTKSTIHIGYDTWATVFRRRDGRAKDRRRKNLRAAPWMIEHARIHEAQEAERRERRDAALGRRGGSRG